MSLGLSTLSEGVAMMKRAHSGLPLHKMTTKARKARCGSNLKGVRMTHRNRFHSVGLSGKMRKMSDRIAVDGRLEMTTGQVESNEPGLPAKRVKSLLSYLKDSA